MVQRRTDIIQSLFTETQGSMVHHPMNMTQALTTGSKGIILHRPINIIQTLFTGIRMVQRLYQHNPISFYGD